jgi:hypothetical protein
MTKKTLAPILALALIAVVGGSAWAAQPQEECPAPTMEQEEVQVPSQDPALQSLPLEPAVKALPMHHGGGYCAIVRTESVAKCKEYCYLQTTCGFHHYSSGYCYCGGDKL